VNRQNLRPAIREYKTLRILRSITDFASFPRHSAEEQLLYMYKQWANIECLQTFRDNNDEYSGKTSAPSMHSVGEHVITLNIDAIK
jgi:hypothetical protein